jgi:hypothetical protein
MILVHAALLGLAVATLRVLWASRAMKRSDGHHVGLPETSGAPFGLRWWPVVVAGVAVQLYLVEGRVLTLPDAGRVAALWATHAALATVLVVNLGRPGMRLLLAGMALNFLVMGANGGLMPVSPETLVRGGRAQVLARTAIGEPTRGNKDVLLREEETRFALLSDRLVIPGQRGSFSVGDVLIAAGIVLALYGAAGAALREMRDARMLGERRTPAASHPGARSAVWGTPAVT